MHILGDFNYSNIDWESRRNKNGTPLSPSEGKLFLDIIHDHNLEQLVNFPTREQNTLDLILTTLPGLTENVHSLDKISDHDILACSLKIYQPPKKKAKRKFYLYSKGDYEAMRAATKDFCCQNYFNSNENNRSLEENWELLKKFLLENIDKHVPSKTSRSVSSVPWLTGSIRKLIRKRNKIHAKAKRTGSETIRAKWKQIRQKIKQELNQSHNNYINQMIGDIKYSPKAFWKYISSQKKDSQGIPPLKTNNTIAEKDLDKAETLNTQFTSVFTHTKYESVPLLERKVPIMNEIKVTVSGVTKLLKNINPSKACGPDGLHPHVLKELANEISPVFSHIFRQSLNQGKIPSDWSLANICPLFKKGDRAQACNYRPVSLTSIPCKLLEHIVCTSMMTHFDKHGIITDKQHAFRKFHSCETQLCTVLNDWSRHLDNRKQVDIFILDFEKAFDTVPHELLKSKLHSYGASGSLLKWIDAFLCHRKQCVVVNSTKSNWTSVVSGVPQGTVLGPLLFSIHINDILRDIDSEIRLFADDCVCYRVIEKDQDTHILQNDIDKLGYWARKWGMRFQPKKCNVMQLSKKKTTINKTYTLEGTPLVKLDAIKYLGVTITKDLKWDQHINNICVKANKTLGLLKRNLSSCPQNVKALAYKGLVRPVLEYSSTVWDPHCQKLQSELEKIKKRAARFVTGNYTYEQGTMTKILEELKWKSLAQRRKENRLILFYKGLKRKANIPVDQLQPLGRGGRKKSQYGL